MPETREQIVELMAQRVAAYQGRSFAEHGDRGIAAKALPVAVKAVTDRVRDAIDEVVFDLSFDDRTRVVAVDDLLPALDRIDAELGGER